MNTKQSDAVYFAMLDLSALVDAEDWMEVCELKNSARETLGELLEAFPEVNARYTEFTGDQ